MLALRKASLVALLLLSALTACGDDSTTANTSPTASSSQTPTAPVSAPPIAPTSSPDPHASATASDCDATGKVIPDGTWHGPITMNVRGEGESSGYAASRGTGQLTLTVRDGRVASGSWTLTWTSHGEANTAEAAATVDLTGTVSGTAKGSAAKPVLPDTWRIKGTAHVTRPVQTSAPFDESGTDQRAMTVLTSTCAQVTGTFVPSFDSKETAATFTGTARWIGTRR